MKKKMVVASMALVLVLGACGNADETNQNDPETGEAAPGSGAIDHGVDENKVGFSMSGDKVEEATGVPKEDKEEILAAFDNYIETLNNQDVEGYLATLSTKGYDLEEERQATEEMLENSTMKRETDNETIVKYSGDSAQLFSTLKTTFTDIETEVENTHEGRQVTVFNKEDGAWKVFSIHFIGDEPGNE
ncbi:DUF3225 domain-containing protein [Sporosarcina sp. P12(2017)]|uniref:DUF3225 domain-containing protein n=1 Tax=unclassified Sporosarcina TaxID=2647733 RepID=UPI000C1649D5|nr:MULTISPECIES: DUF3225 domain-containing protein [unclassified Sporosarcina]PIC58444.1 DUF3225 domain-containing protein [Sporosarcina sp. P10]PIC59330.1 DUF3225 domain-containing protein [Sporosarcina sp. P12(2017)]